MSGGDWDGVSLDAGDLPPGWHLKAVAVLAVLLLGAVFTAWKLIL